MDGGQVVSEQARDKLAGVWVAPYLGRVLVRLSWLVWTFWCALGRPWVGQDPALGTGAWLVLPLPGVNPLVKGQALACGPGSIKCYLLGMIKLDASPVELSKGPVLKAPCMG